MESWIKEQERMTLELLTQQLREYTAEVSNRGMYPLTLDGIKNQTEMKTLSNEINPHALDIPEDDRFWDNVTISQSLIQALKQAHCPFAVFHVTIARTVPRDNENMLRGQYFEYHVLGETALGKTPIELPTLQSGKQSVDHQRIDEQVLEFQSVMKNHNIKFITKQLKLEFNDKRFKYRLSGTIDAIGTITDETTIQNWINEQANNIFKDTTDNDLPVQEIADEMRKAGTPAMFDVKLTKSINNQVGDWSWKYPQNMPSTQPAMYTKLMMAIMQKKYPFYYLVFDYSTSMDHIIVRKEIGAIDISELEGDIRDTEVKLEEYRANGFEYNPEYYRCKECPLLNSCPKAILIKPIVNV